MKFGMIGAAKIAVVSLVAAHTAPINAQERLVRIPTDAKCDFVVKFNQFTPKNVIDDMISNWKYSWTGRCTDGLLSGYGQLSRSQLGILMLVDGYFREGISIGYSKTRTQFKAPEGTLTSDVEWSFSDGVTTVTFSGLGFVGDDALLANVPKTVPVRTTSLPADWARVRNIHAPHALALKTGLRTLVLFSDVCFSSPEFPECPSFSQPSIKRIHYFLIHEIAAQSRIPPKKIYCPAPHDPRSCDAVIDAVLAPLIDEAELSIRRGWQRLEETDPTSLAEMKIGR